LLKNPGNGRLNNLNDLVLNVLNCHQEKKYLENAAEFVQKCMFNFFGFLL